MNIWRIIFANLKHSRRLHLGTCLGLALASMILVGSLTIGDSVRATLWNKATERIGLVTHVFLSEETYFHADLADRIKLTQSLEGSAKIAPVLVSSGNLTSPDGKVRAGGITVLGIDERFFHFTNKLGMIPDLSKQGFWASPDLATELGAEIGLRLVLRVEEPSLFSRDAPLSGERDARFIAWNQPYLGKMESSSMGNFSLRANMEPIRTIFMPLSMMQDSMLATFSPEDGRTDFANLLLVQTTSSNDSLLDGINQCWKLADGGLEIKKLRESNTWNLRTRRVFLSDRIASTARQASANLKGELTYLVNAIRKNNQSGDLALIPYSMVTGIEPSSGGYIEPDWDDQKMSINQWAANDLNLSVGDFVTLEYFVVGKHRKLIEKSRSFEVGKIISMNGKIPAGEESDWTPRFPGLSDAQNCGEWDTGIPIKHEIRPKDELYWDDYRGTPKAFVSLKSAQEMWGNRWGNLTGLRIHGKQEAMKLGEQLLKELSPATFGLKMIDLKQSATEAVSGPVDFSQLFLAFGFFVVLAGLSLSALVFGFSLEQRNKQVGTLLALGYTLKRVALISSIEAGLVCLIGTLMGVGWAWFFGHGVLWMLNGAWGGAVSKLSISYMPNMESIILGTVSSFLVGLLSLIWVGVRQRKRSSVELIQAGSFQCNYNSTEKDKKRSYRIGWFEAFTWIALLLLLINSWIFQILPTVSFFGMGALILLGGLIRFFRHYADAVKIRSQKEKDLLCILDYRPGRKITLVGILATGTFLIIGAGAFKQNSTVNTYTSRSESGGFSCILKTSLPLYDNLMSVEATERFDLKTEYLKDITIVPLRTYAGDDASCLNLHQSKLPPLYGLSISQMSNRFNFVDGNWLSLEKTDKANVIPAAVDQNTLMWALKKKVGDRITYLDSEGREFDVELRAVIKGSFLQGGLYISEENWVKSFPDHGGYHEFWISGKEGDRAVDHLKDRLFNYGVQTQSVIERLDMLKKVENTYLSIFQSLGGLGVLIGTIGTFIIVLRNLWERRSEKAILGALGFSLTHLQSMAVRENSRIISGGLLLGVIAGLIGLVPSTLKNHHGLSIGLVGFVCGLFILSYLSLVMAVRFGLHQLPTDELRDE